jgi:hypothetical protein
MFQTRQARSAAVCNATMSEAENDVPGIGGFASYGAIVRLRAPGPIVAIIICSHCHTLDALSEAPNGEVTMERLRMVYVEVTDIVSEPAAAPCLVTPGANQTFGTCQSTLTFNTSCNVACAAGSFAARSTNVTCARAGTSVAVANDVCQSMSKSARRCQHETAGMEYTAHS